MVNKITASQTSIFYNQLTTRVLINNGRFRQVWCSQCNGGQNRKRCKHPIKIASNMQNEKKSHFHSSYIYIIIMPLRPQKKF